MIEILYRVITFASKKCVENQVRTSYLIAMNYSGGGSSKILKGTGTENFGLREGYPLKNALALVHLFSDYEKCCYFSWYFFYFLDFSLIFSSSSEFPPPACDELMNQKFWYSPQRDSFSGAGSHSHISLPLHKNQSDNCCLIDNISVRLIGFFNFN